MNEKQVEILGYIHEELRNITYQLTLIAGQGKPTRIVFATKVIKKDSIKCLDCDLIANEAEFQILDKRGDYLKCPKCGAENDRLSDSEPATPAPDALVEAVKKACESLEYLFEQVDDKKEEPVPSLLYIHKSLRIAINAHEGVVRK